MPGGEIREPSRLEARDSRGRTVLIVAATDKDAAYLSSLIELGSNVDAQDYDGETALMAAVKCGNFDSIFILLFKGEAKTHYQDSSGCTALHLAAQHGSIEIIRLIVSSWADTNITNNKGHRPIDTVPSVRDEIRTFLLHSPVEKAGCLLKALAKEFQSLIIASEDFLQRNITFPHLPLSSSGASSTSNGRKMRVSPGSSVHISGLCSSSVRASHSTLSTLVFRFLDLRIILQHRVSELASDYGDRDNHQTIQSHAHLKGANKYQERAHARGNDGHNRKSTLLSHTGDRLGEVQWCLEVLNETCRIFHIVFPASIPLTDLRKWTVQSEIDEQGILSGGNWVICPPKGLVAVSANMKNDERSAFRRRKDSNLRASSSVSDSRYKATPLLSNLLHQGSYSLDIEASRPNISGSPALSIQNLMFTQVPELYEQHLAALNERNVPMSITPVVRARRCNIC